MPEYQCRVGTPKGEILLKTVFAENAESARRTLVNEGYWVFEIKEKKGVKSFLSELLPTKKKVSQRNFLLMNQEFATLIRAGLPIVSCIEILEERQRDPLLKYILGIVKTKLKAGASLAEAFESFQELIPGIYIANLYAGEKSGQLERVLRRYTHYEDLLYRLRKTVTSSLTYPLILLGLATILLTILFTYVIPRFVSFYAEFGADLPLVTYMVLQFSRYLKVFLPFFILSVIILVIVFRISWHFRPEWKKRWHGMLLRVWIFGSIMSTYAFSQFSHALSTLLSGGLPLVHSLEVAARSIWNLAIQDAILNVRQRVKEGESLHDALVNAGINADILLEMVRVGEATGALGEMLEFAGNFYDEDLEHSLNRIMSLIEPALLISMGIIVLIVLISVYYPIFSIATKIRV